MWKPRQEMIEEKKILKIEDMCGNEVYLGREFVLEVWSLETVLSYRLSFSPASNFKHFYDDVIRVVAGMSGEANTNIYNIINRLLEKFDVCCMLEVLLCIPEKVLFDVQLERRIQEQGQKRIKLLKHLSKKMWMLYAEQHWTKAIDLKSAVERLYENLGALGFDADHEAINGMEKYYTVEQCEQLRDKYKIGRKCLTDRLSKFGLQHFLDTINKYIGNSDTSDKEYKAVKRNGEGSKTTKEEEESKKSKGERITKPVS
ncbi:hypothetical protein FQA39_LY04990 [Lamprigera yunnana]|nr:hypothetical protein FQA39_LY04990 [Lamprigera yunnana]